MNNTKSSCDVKKMIAYIEVLYEEDDPTLNNVNDIDMLYDALWDLDEIVGMENIKSSIIKLLKYLLIDTSLNNSHKFDNHMLHTVIYGPPGVGKTMVGSVLAKIWSSLGLLKKDIKKDTIDLANQLIRLALIAGYKKDELLSKTRDQSTNTNDNQNEYMSTPAEKPQESFRSSPPSKEPFRSSLPSKEPFRSSLPSSISSVNKEVKPNVIYHKRNLDNMKTTLAITKYNPPLIGSVPHSTIKATRSISTSSLPLRLPPPIFSPVPIMTEKLCSIKKESIDIGHDKNDVTKTSLTRKKFKSPIKIVSRNDFVGQYLGQTADKTNKLLTATLNEGKALFIDEAYSLINDGRDSYGNEALNELNKFMSEKPELVVIFAGYKDKMEETLFKQQPGFKRRCTWTFHIDKYKPEMLTRIFLNQINASGWKYDGTENGLNRFFTDNFDYFKAYGGDTQKFALYCKLTYSEIRFDQNIGLIKPLTVIYKTLTHDIINKAFDSYKEHYLDKTEELDESIRRMYS